jgi:hypothetical protein
MTTVRPLTRLLPLLALVACHSAPPPYVEQREPCAERSAARSVFFGDLHVHTGFSFDAYGYAVTVTPEDAYRFAKGEPVLLPPLDAGGQPSREVRLERPLDFAMVSDHAEFLGEVSVCATPGGAGYDSDVCRSYRVGGDDAVAGFAIATSLSAPPRLDVCGPGDTSCITPAARARWEDLQRAAESHYDRTAACGFVTFVGYEYTNTIDVANRHRHVMFRNDRVPSLPISHFEAPEVPELWRKLAAECLDAGDGCDAMSLAHNSTLSNGHEFGDPLGATLEQEREVAALRARVETMAEIFQHKGASECRNGLAGVNGADDPYCAFEEVMPGDAPDCGDGLGTGGMRLWGCVSRHDYLRTVLKDGLQAEARLGVNPFKLGLIGSTDTHNGTPGKVEEHDFGGHVGTVDDTPAKRLGAGTATHDTVINNPGGLAAVWAEERSRDAIFAALRRREVYATSGPRLEVRFFGGWGFDAAACAAPDAAAAYAGGVPMGGDLPAAPAADAQPTFLVWANADPGTPLRPGTPLERIQIVKGWLDAGGATWEEVHDVVVGGDGTASVDPATCAPVGPGAASLCGAWTDAGFDPAQRAFYYVRVLENPSCRWSAWECLRWGPADQPATCSDPAIPWTVQERAWTSPIWYAPAS